MFGGDTMADGALGDTWERDAGTWRRVATSGPPPRTVHVMAYDSDRKRVVLFGSGGAGPDDRAETWTFDGSIWRRVATSGPRRMNPKLVFDSSSKAVVLFGGFNEGPSNEVWRFSWSSWERLAP